MFLLHHFWWWHHFQVFTEVISDHKPGRNMLSPSLWCFQFPPMLIPLAKSRFYPQKCKQMTVLNFDSKLYVVGEHASIFLHTLCVCFCAQSPVHLYIYICSLCLQIISDIMCHPASNVYHALIPQLPLDLCNFYISKIIFEMACFPFELNSPEQILTQKHNPWECWLSDCPIFIISAELGLSTHFRHGLITMIEGKPLSAISELLSSKSRSINHNICCDSQQFAALSNEYECLHIRMSFTGKTSSNSRCFFSECQWKAGNDV